MRIRRIILVFISICTASLFAQSIQQWSASEINHHLQKLKVMGSVLYVAAHPDDENTRLITWLANEKKVNAAYFSVTRGDGGQNLIGSELSDLLGVIRTQELTQARNIDGGIQFFSRSNDFGYSKDPKETFQIWDKHKTLGDLVYVIRRFQPDLIITRFNMEAGRTHGHHTASSILANQAIELSADSNEFDRQLTYVNTWQPERVVWNTSSWFYKKDFNMDTLMKINVGGYNGLLGKSYTEIAALSRSKHLSQGFGTSGTRGEEMEYFISSAGSTPTDKDIFSGIDFTWNRIKNGKSIESKINGIIQKFDFNDPSKSVESLISLWQDVKKLKDESYLVQQKLDDIAELIYQCMGFYHEVYTDDYIYAVGDTIRLKTETINRCGKYLTYINMRLPFQSEWLVNNFEYNRQVNTDEGQKWTSQVMQIKDDAPFSNPQWWDVKSMEDDPVKYRRSIENINFEPFTYHIIPSFNGKKPIDDLVFTGNIMYKTSDPAKGEIHQPIYLAPPVTATPVQKVLVWRKEESKRINVELQAFKSNVDGVVKLNVPEGWKVSPKEIKFNLQQKRETQQVEFMVTPPDSNSSGQLTVDVICNRRGYSASYKEINYDHIPTIVVFPEAKVELVKIGSDHQASSIAYIEGAGDEVSQDISEAGYQVDIIPKDQLLSTDYSKYSAVILGIRSYNTIEQIQSLQGILFSYVNSGGRLIVQYVTTRNLQSEENGPYPFKISRDRVTDEKADMLMLDTLHPIFNYPYKITQDDFKGWVQERGLYFASEMDSLHYVPLLACSDPGEEASTGALIVARYGEGYFIYTGLSFFRQLPAGVPGAYKLLINMVEWKDK